MNVLNQIDTNKYNKDIGILLAYALMFPTIDSTIEGIFRLVGISTLGASILTYTISIIYIGLCISKNNRVILKFITIYCIIVVFFIINYLIFENTRQFYSEYFLNLRRIFVIYIPIAILVSGVNDFSFFIKRMGELSKIGILLVIAGMLIGYLNYNNYMIFSLHFLPFLLFIYYSWIKDKKPIDFIFFIISFFIILLFGGRASLLTVVVFVIGCSILETHFKSKRKSIVYTISLILAAYFLILFSDFMMVLITYIFDTLGLQNRNLEKIKQGNLFSFSTRDYIYANVIGEVKKLNWYTINGIFGDRYLIRQYGSWISYSHNIFLEIILSFGFIFGSIIILKLIIDTIIGLLRGSIIRRVTILAFVCLVMMRLFVSGSFVIEDNFYLMLGVLSSKFLSKVKLVG
jgi:hypothetical protein